MRLPATAHTSRPWLIHQIAPDFVVEDVWALPTPGGHDDLSVLVSTIFESNFPEGAPVIVRALWEARYKLGAALGWDREDSGTGSGVASLRDRLPSDFVDAPADPELDMGPFTRTYQREDEWAAETANRTVHAVMHLGWVPAESGGYRGQLAVLVRPNELLGTAYMAAIKPLRHYVVYPALLRRIERDWSAQLGGSVYDR